MNFFSRASLGRYRHAGATAALLLATATCGCGSSGSTNPVDAKLEGKSVAELLTPEQEYKYEGTGKNRRKVQISRRERMKLIRESASKQ